MIARMMTVWNLYAMHRDMDFGPIASARWAVSIAFTRNPI